MIRKPALFVLLIFHICTFLVAQNEQCQFDSLSVLETYSISYLNSENGLLQNEVKSLYYHPKSKILWLATQQGLVRYSGRKAEILTPNNNPLVPHSRIRDFYLLNDSALIVYGDDHKFSEIAPDGIHLQPSEIRAKDYMFCDRGNVISGSVARDFSFYHIALSGPCAYTLMEKGEKLNLKLVCNQMPNTINVNLGYYFQHHSFSIKDRLLGITRSGHFLQIRGLQVDTLGFYPKFVEDEVQVIWHRYYPSAYLFSRGQLRRVSLDSSGVVKISLLAENIPNAEFNACWEVPEHNRIFLGTRRKGLMILNPQAVQQVFNDDYCRSPYSNYALAEIGMDSVITADGLIFRPDGLDCSRRFNISEFWYPLLYDSAHKVLHTAGSRTSLRRYQLGKGPWFYADDSLDVNSNGRFPGPMVAYRDRLYALVENYGLCIFKNDSWCLLGQESRDLAKPRQLLFENDSSLWLTYRYGLCRFNPFTGEKKGLHYPLPILNGRALAKIDDKIWFSAYGSGLYVQKGDSLQHFLPPEYPQLEAIHAIVPVTGNLVLFSTNNGLFLFDKADIYAFLEGAISKIQAYAYTNTDGLLQNEFNGGCQPAHLKLSSGKWAFPNLTGLSFLNANFLSLAPRLSDHVAIESVYYDNVDTSYCQSLKLSPNFKNLRLNLIHAYYGDVSNAKVYYRIPELQQDWRLIDFDKGIQFDRLPSNQSYSIQLLIPGLERSKRLQTLMKFEVLPRFTQKPIFHFILLISSLSLLLIILRIQRRKAFRQESRLRAIIAERTGELAKRNVRLKTTVERLEASQEELRDSITIRNKMITVFSHDIRGPLRFLSDIASALAARENQNSKEELKNELEVLASGARGAYATANNVLEWIRSSTLNQQSQEQSLVAAVERVVAQKEGVTMQHRLRILQELEADLTVLASPKALEIIIENILQNALKYCKSLIAIKTYRCSDGLHLDIIDDGPGIKDKQTLKRLNSGQSVRSTPGQRGDNGAGVGLLMVRELLEQIGDATLLFENRERGFQVRITFAS